MGIQIVVPQENGKAALEDLSQEHIENPPTFEYAWLAHSNNTQTSPMVRRPYKMLPTCRPVPAPLWRGSDPGMKEVPSQK